MFDSFYLDATCPYCGNREIFEFQTKLFGCTMKEWHEGDTFHHMEKGKVKMLIGGCNSKACRAWERKHEGYNSGLGRIFWCDVEINDGKVIKAINVRKYDDM